MDLRVFYKQFPEAFLRNGSEGDVYEDVVVSLVGNRLFGSAVAHFHVVPLRPEVRHIFMARCVTQPFVVPLPVLYFELVPLFCEELGERVLCGAF